ncbi:MAG: 30S ribosomal protein S2 [Verrucomicrobia bacterium 21-51-4]|nr:MAG: 30S ribosomal protein S2 [Verrucomicrobia bacterium 21-51-4]HQU08772.1 30S ribosomal protein S2 [Opitutales bacterium]
MNITVQDLFDAGVHFGHQMRRWNPLSKPFVYANRGGISIIDLEKTYTQLELASEFLKELVANGKDVLWVGTKRQTQEIVREAAGATQMPFCAHRWLGGCLTNFETIKRSLEKFKRFQTMDADGTLAKMPKKEVAVIRREMERMHRNFEGIQTMRNLPAALIVIDTNHEAIAVAEANRLGIPVVALVDTNSNPFVAQYPIPGNDDAAKSIRVIAEALAEAIQEGAAARVSQKPLPKAFMAAAARQEFSDVQPEVTLAADIEFSDDDGVVAEGSGTAVKAPAASPRRKPTTGGGAPRRPAAKKA